MRVLDAASSHRYQISSQKLLILGAAVLAAALLMVVSRGQAAPNSHSLSVDQPDTSNPQLLDETSAAPTGFDSAGASQSDGSSVINTDSSSLSVQVNSKSTTNSDGQTTTSNSLNVNGQPVPLKPSNNLRQTIRSSNGSATVNISVQNSSGGGGM
jgi:hypothetical protein